MDHYRQGNGEDNPRNRILAPIAAEFPFETYKNGTCTMLVDNHCSVYETRPLLCDFKKIWEQHPDIAMNELEWYLMNMKVCNFFMDQAETPPSMRLKEPCSWK